MVVFKPSEKADELRGIFINLTNIYGINLPDSPLLPPQLIFCLVYLILIEVMQVNGLYQSWPNFIKICNNLPIYGVGLQLVVRLLCMVIRNDQKNVADIQNCINKFYKREEQIDEHRIILMKRLEVCEFIMRFSLFQYFLWFHTPTLTAVVTSWYTGEFILFTPIYLPFTDPTTIFGYIINCALMSFGTFIVSLMLTSGELCSIYFIYQTGPMMDICALKLRNCGEKLCKIKEELKNPKPSTSKKVSKIIQQREEEARRLLILRRLKTVENQFIEHLKELKDYTKFLELTINYLRVITYTILSTNSIAIGMSIVTALFFSKVIGFALGIMFVSQLLMVCIQGTFVTYQKEKLLSELWLFPWHELSKPKQKIFLQFLHFYQHAHEFSIAIFGVINMELFTNVMNVTYSYFMIMLKFIKNN